MVLFVILSDQDYFMQVRKYFGIRSTILPRNWLPEYESRNIVIVLCQKLYLIWQLIYSLPLKLIFNQKIAFDI